MSVDDAFSLLSNYTPVTTAGSPSRQPENFARRAGQMASGSLASRPPDRCCQRSAVRTAWITRASFRQIPSSGHTLSFVEVHVVTQKNE